MKRSALLIVTVIITFKLPISFENGPKLSPGLGLIVSLVAVPCPYLPFKFNNRLSKISLARYFTLTTTLENVND